MRKTRRPEIPSNRDARPDAVWKVAPLEKAEAVEARGWIGRLLHRREPTTFERCLAVHMHYAAPHSRLS